MICHRCGSRNTERLRQLTICYYSCGPAHNADFNAAINIGSDFLTWGGANGVQLNHPELRMNRLKGLENAAAGLLPGAVHIPNAACRRSCRAV